MSVNLEFVCHMILVYSYLSERTGGRMVFNANIFLASLGPSYMIAPFATFLQI